MYDSVFIILAPLIYFIFAMLFIGWIPAVIAKCKGRSFFLWWVYGSSLFVVALSHALLIKPYAIREPLSKLLYVDIHTDQIHSDRNLVANIYGLLAVPVPVVHELCVVMNFARLRAVKDTWLESHFYWQTNTALISLALEIVLVVAAFLMGFGAYIIISLLKYIWIIYRITKGYIVLRRMEALVI